MKHTHHFIISLACMALSLFVFADSGRLYKSDKLASSLINCICQDRYGYIWVGTEYGLSKFDGYRFTNFLHNRNDTTSITDNIISAFLVDRQGRLWIGSAKGLMRYDYHANNFRRYPLPDGRKPRVYSLIESHKGDVLIGTAGYGLYSIRRGADKVKHEKAYSPKDSDMFYTHIYDDGRGYLWQSSHLPMFTRFTSGGGRTVMKNFNSPCGAPIAFARRKNGNLLIVCLYGIIDYDYTTGRIADAGYDFGSYKGNITINSATVDHVGNIYIGTSENGVLMIRRGTKRLVQMESGNNERFNITTSFVNSIMEDKDHNLWVGCYKKGLYLMNQRKAAFHSWSFSAQNYAIGSSVSSIAAGDNGDTWCTVQNSGVFRFDRNGKIVGHPISPTGTSIIYRDRQGSFWLGTGSALYSYDPMTGAAEERLHYAGAGIYCMADDGAGHLFISVYSKGLYIYNVETGDVKILSMSQLGAHGHLCNDWIRGMTTDGHGQLWIGTSNGASCMNISTLGFNDHGWNTLLMGRQVNCLTEGSDGNIIMGTDEGLYLYDKEKNRTVPFPNSSQLDDKQICGIVRDHNGGLWVSTTMGIWQYSQQTKRFIGHINGNGLMSREYVLGAVMHNADDRIGFGTGDGITAFYPNDVTGRRMKMGDVHLTNFIVDGKPIDCLSDNFEIPHSENTFSLEFSLLNYQNTDNISYRYRINNGSWLSTDEGVNSITFTKLKSGEYTIQVKAANNGILSHGTKTINIHVDAPWYASTWALFIYAFIIAVIIYLCLLTYERHRRADMEEQKMRFLIDATHDIRSPLTLITGPLNRLKEMFADNSVTYSGGHSPISYIETIDRNAQRLLLLVNQILDERKIDKNQMKLHCQETDMVEFIKNICSLYQYNAQQRNIKLSFDSAHNAPEQGVHAWIDRINFDKVISNLLSNAMKYTFDGGEVEILMTSDDKNINIKVIDTGIGFKDEKTERLFERFYQGKNSNSLHIEGTGIGLNLSRAIVEMHGGKIKAYNRTDGKCGACLEVTLPLGREHLKPEEIMNEEDTAVTVTETKTQANRNFKILVVDDDREIAAYIESELGKWFHFGYAPNGKEGLKQLLTGDYDLVISDVIMPVMDGITMLKNLKNNPNINDIPVIMLTSKSEVSDRMEGLKKGADAFIAKPFSMEELHILIDNLVDNVRRLRGKFSGAQSQEDKLEKVEVNGNDDALMKRIMESINSNLSDPDYNVEQLTTDVGISRAHLHRKMKEMTGISTGEFIRNLRLEQAARLMREGKINVTQVAYTVGFNNQTHFSTAFKKHFGMTPTEYAEKEGEE